MGQCLYLASAALGLGATGIGAFFDDKVHEYLNFDASARAGGVPLRYRVSR